MAWKDFVPFESSNIATIRYDVEQSTLEVEFRNGGRYHYYDVPEHVAQAFEHAESKGVYLAQNIKGNFRYSRV
jgi:hypothetical protein